MKAPEPTLGLLVIAARQIIRQAVKERARTLRLTVPEFWALYHVRSAPGVTHGELGQRLLLGAPATSRLITALVKRRLVEARPDRQDRRRSLLFLTEKGEPLGDGVQAAAEAYQADALRGLSDEELAVARAVLSRLTANLQHAEGGARRPPRAARAG